MKSTKIELPEKEKLIEVLAQVKGKTKAIRHAAKVYFTSMTPISNWIKEYGIQFDDSGMVIREGNEPVGPERKVSLLKEIALEVKPEFSIPGYETITDATVAKQADTQESNFASEILELLKEAKPEIVNDFKVTIIDQETNELPYKLGYAEYDIEGVLVQVDFRKQLVSINNSKDMTFEECNGVLELLNQII